MNLTSTPPVVTSTTARYPNPGYQGSSSLSNVFDQIPADTTYPPAISPLDRLHDPLHTHCNLVSEEQIAYGARVLEGLVVTIPGAASSRILNSWTGRGNNLSAADAVAVKCYTAAAKLVDDLQSKKRAASQISQELFDRSSQPLHAGAITTLDEYCDQFCGSNVRWETLGLFVTAVTRASGDFAVFEGLYDHESRHTFQRAAMHTSDNLLYLCLSLDRLDDLQLLLQYENFILHSCTEGDQSKTAASRYCRMLIGTGYHSWRRLGDVISSLFALGYHRQPDMQPNVPAFLQELRMTAFGRAYSADKNVSIFLGRPPRLHRRYCSFQLPRATGTTIRGGDRSPLSHPVNWTSDDTFTYVTDTKWSTICAILKSDLLDILEEDDRDQRHRSAKYVRPVAPLT